MGILWASNYTRPSVTLLTDGPSDPGLDTTALLQFWLHVFQAQGAPAHPSSPTLSSAGNLGAKIPLVTSEDGGKPGPAHPKSDAASSPEQHPLGKTSSPFLLALSAPSQNQELEDQVDTRKRPRRRKLGDFLIPVVYQPLLIQLSSRKSNTLLPPLLFAFTC